MTMLTGASGARAVEVTPIANLQVLGGQYFYTSEKGALTGNASGTFAPALKFNDSLSLLPSISSVYQGTKQVVDLVGSGTVFQEQMDHRVSVRGIIQPERTEWRIKPSMYFKYQLLKETKDEDWSKGLFDYRRWGGGLEAEYVFHDPHSARVGFDYFETEFPNYTTLESQTALKVQGGDVLARELVGDSVLNTRNWSGFAGVDYALSERMIADFNAYLLYQVFPRQKVVDDTGGFMPQTREDFTTTFALGLKFPAEVMPSLRLLGSLDSSLSYNTSNQNNFDAQQTKFNRFYYNYGQVSAGPTLRFYYGDMKRPVAFDVGARWWFRRYPHRQAQDGNGVYLNDPLKTHTWMMTTSLRYPMAPRFSLIFNFQYGQGDSNQRFEQFYSYNYHVANYLFGFNYEY